jgi:CRP-like cAMP-binding protein
MTTSLLTDVIALAPSATARTVLIRRGQTLSHALHLRTGRVTLGLVDSGHLTHQLGVVEGPFWLEAASSLLGLSPVMDAVSETPVQLQWVPLLAFHASVQAVTEPAQSLLTDLASAQRQQTELAVSRLAKDADARCAEWLLRHAEPADKLGAMVVTLNQRKRLIAAQLGIAPETFSRVLGHLRSLNLISGSGRMLFLPDPQGLRALAEA